MKMSLRMFALALLSAAPAHAIVGGGVPSAEGVGRSVDLALGEGPQFDGFHPAREGVGQVPQCQQARGSGQQEPARPRVSATSTNISGSSFSAG